jgi:hypothetical protein
MAEDMQARPVDDRLGHPTPAFDKCFAEAPWCQLDSRQSWRWKGRARLIRGPVTWRYRGYRLHGWSHGWSEYQPPCQNVLNRLAHVRQPREPHRLEPTEKHTWREERGEGEDGRGGRSQADMGEICDVGRRVAETDAMMRVVRHHTPPDAELPRKDPSASRRVRRFGLQALGRGVSYVFIKKSINTNIQNANDH